MKKIVVLIICALASPIIHCAQFIVVECYGLPERYGYFSEPGTGILHKANSCGEALAKVPANYYFLSSVGAGQELNSGIKYLFSDVPAHRE